MKNFFRTFFFKKYKYNEKDNPNNLKYNHEKRFKKMDFLKNDEYEVIEASPLTTPELFNHMNYVLDHPNEECIPYFQYGDGETFKELFGENELRSLTFLNIKDKFDKFMKEYEESEKKDTGENFLKWNTFFEIIIFKTIELIFDLNLCLRYLNYGINNSLVGREKIILNGLKDSLMNGEHLMLNFHGIFNMLIKKLVNIDNKGNFPLQSQIPGEANFRKYNEINDMLKHPHFEEESKKKIQIEFLQYEHVTAKNPSFESYSWFLTYKNNCTEVMYELFFDSRTFHVTSKIREEVHEIFSDVFSDKALTDTIMIGFRFEGKRLFWTITSNDTFGEYKRAIVEEKIYNNKLNNKDQIPMLVNYINLLKQERDEFKILYEQSKKQ
jgi:hypothetical protein